MSDYKDKANYEATVVDQRFGDYKGDPVLYVTARITGKYRNGFDLSRGTDPCPETERDLFIPLKPNPMDLEKTYKTLDILGFTDPDVTKLHPNSPNFVNLKGRKVPLYYNADKDKFYISTFKSKPQESLGLDVLKKYVSENQDLLEESSKRVLEELPF